MKIYPKQKVNAFLAAIVSGLAGGMLSGGYAGLEDALFARVVGLAILTAGLVQAYQDLLQDPPASGSSDLILGVGRAVLGGWLLLFPAQGAAGMRQLLTGAVLFHGLYILQQAVLLRRARARKAAILAGLALVSLGFGLAMALLPDSLLAALGLALPLYADTGMLLAAGFLLLFTLSEGEEPLPGKKPHVKKPAAAAKKPGKAPQEGPAAANEGADGAAPPQDARPPEKAAAADAGAEKETQTQTEPAGGAETGEAARAAAEREQAEQARRAARAARREKEEEQAAMSALQALGHMAGKAKKRAGQTAKNTVAGFKAGLHDGE